MAPSLLACPGCGALMRAEDLKRLAAEAAGAAEHNDAQGEIAAWRNALDLLPPDCDQYRTIASRVEELGRRIDAGQTSASTRPLPPLPDTAPGARSAKKAGWGAGLVALGLVLFKFKAPLLLLLSKGKLLVLGLTKMSTLGSMVLSLGVYWSLWGWKFAVGLIASIYVHEMGHVWELRKYGFRASAPTFIPGLGALIRLRQHPVSAIEDARVGLAGPLWGLAAAAVCLGVYAATGNRFWGAVATVGAWINLFNLLPVFSLDGARGFRALSRLQRVLVTGAFVGCWLWVHDGMLLLLAIVSGAVSFAGRPSDQPDSRTLVYFVGLVVLLSAMLLVRIPGHD